MESLPMGSADVVKVAVLVKPDPGVKVPVPIGVAMPVAVFTWLKTTVPVGAASLPDRVAENVTGWPAGDGLGAPVRAALLVVSCSTVMVTGSDVDGVWVISPV